MTKNKYLEYLKENQTRYNNALDNVQTAINELEKVIMSRKTIELLKLVWKHLHETTTQKDFDKLVNSLTKEQRLFLLDMDLSDNE